MITTAGVRNNWGRVHWTYSEWDLPVTFLALSHQYAGNTVCQTGRTTTGITGNLNLTNRCGIVQTTAYTPQYSGSDGAYYPAFGYATYQRAGGDSGAAVIFPTIYGAGAVGIHGGPHHTTQQGVFSRMQLIASEWGLELSPS